MPLAGSDLLRRNTLLLHCRGDRGPDLAHFSNLALDCVYGVVSRHLHRLDLSGDLLSRFGHLENAYPRFGLSTKAAFAMKTLSSDISSILNSFFLVSSTILSFFNPNIGSFFSSIKERNGNSMFG